MSSPIAVPAGSGWTVTGQAEATIIDPTGRVREGYNVTFLTGNNVSGTVFVPHDQYTADYVRSMISARVQSLDAVHNLSSDS